MDDRPIPVSSRPVDDKDPLVRLCSSVSRVQVKALIRVLTLKSILICLCGVGAKSAGNSSLTPGM